MTSAKVQTNPETTRRLVGWSVVVVASMLTAIGLACLGQTMAPIQHGTAEGFWDAACGVDLGNASEWPGRAYIVDDSWVAYDMPHLHGSDAFRVNRGAAEAMLPKAVEWLREQHESGHETIYTRAYGAWLAEPHDRRTFERLIEYGRRERQKLLARDPDVLAHSLWSDQVFWHRWQRGKWYWANFAFEWLFLSGLALFAVWPLIRGQSFLRGILHTACLPLLFLTPAFLGYAWTTFSSSGPSGGVLYPFLLIPFRIGGATGFDHWLLERLPKLLEPLSTPIGIPIAVTGAPIPGPIGAALAGVGFAFTMQLMQLVRSHRRRLTMG